MEFQEYMKIRKRMTKSGDDACCGQVSCDDCPLSKNNNGFNMICTKLERNYPAEAEAIVRQWAEEHPVKTRQDKFLEIFPNWGKFKDGVINILPCCVDKYYGCYKSPRTEKCSTCAKKYWLGEYEEPKED